jgi:threonine/homoserine/homoserine lactone efflux protein
VDILTALGSGLLAGWGIALPLGAVAALLLAEGMTRGFARGWPGAVAVAAVDVAYCALALSVGAAAATVVARYDPWPVVVGGVALVVIAAVGTVRASAPQRTAAVDGRPEGGSELSSGRRRFALFFGLTAVNPATLVYFAALAVAVAPSTPATTGAFVTGVGVASASWQLALVAVGATVRGRATPRTRYVTTLVGNAIVALLGVAMVIRALV